MKLNLQKKWKAIFFFLLVKDDEHEEIREIVSNLKEMEAQEGDLEENKRRTNLSNQKGQLKGTVGVLLSELRFTDLQPIVDLRRNMMFLSFLFYNLLELINF